MPDKGIQIVIALLEKRESYLITKDSNSGLVEELLRAERLGYVQKEEKSAKYTLSEKGCRWVYSGFAEEDTLPLEVVAKVEATTPEPQMPAQPSSPTAAVIGKGDLRPAYASSFLITSMFLLTVWILWVLDLA
jgi:hypothetical protein